jgi:hypothetical protein
MRPQVQALAGPPPSSQVRALPAVSWERSLPAGAACPSPAALCESGSCFPLWLRLLADSFRTRLRVLGDGGSGRCVTVAG